MERFLVPELMVDVANRPLVICTAVPEAMLWVVAEVGKVMPVLVLEPTMPMLVTLVVMATPR